MALAYSSDDDEVLSLESSSEDEKDENIKEHSPHLENIDFNYNVALGILKEAPSTGSHLLFFTVGTFQMSRL